MTGSLANHYDTVVTGRLVERLNRIGKWAVLVSVVAMTLGVLYRMWRSGPVRVTRGRS